MLISLRKYLLAFGAILSILFSQINMKGDIQFAIFLFTLILFGIPHGALDLKIDSNFSSDQIKKKSLYTYLILVTSYALLWYVLPLFSFIVFLLITSYHFGQIDWTGMNHKRYHKILFSIFGMLWILYFITNNITDELIIIQTLTKTKWSNYEIVNLATLLNKITLLIIISLFFLLSIFKKWLFSKWSDYLLFGIQFLVLFAISNWCPLWIGFGFYFGVWHSLLSFDKIRMSMNFPQTITSWKRLLKEALPFSLMAWIGMLFFLFSFYNPNNNNVSLLFITLSVLTLPHIFVFSKLSE